MKYEVVKFVNNNLELEVNVSPNEETVWLSLADLCLLFDRDKSVISRHIKNIFKDNELIEKQVVAKNATTGSDGKIYQVTFYNLDVIISVGYRVKSQNGIAFRKWATNVLKEYLMSRAKETIVLIDPYTDEKTLNVIKNKQDNVCATIITSKKTKLSQIDIDTFNNKYGNLKLIIKNDYHDRYIIIDDFIFYHLGTSINYFGNKFAQMDKIEDEDVKELLRKRINEQE